MWSFLADMAMSADMPNNATCRVNGSIAKLIGSTTGCTIKSIAANNYNKNCSNCVANASTYKNNWIMPSSSMTMPSVSAQPEETRNGVPRRMPSFPRRWKDPRPSATS